MLEHLETRERKVIDVLKLYQSIEDGAVTADVLKETVEVPRFLTDQFDGARKMSASQQRTLLDKLRWLDALKLAGVEPNPNSTRARLVHAQLAAGKLVDALQFSLSTLRRGWLKLDRANGDVAVLLPDFQRRGGGGHPRTHSEAEAVLQEQIEIEREKLIPRTHVEIHNEISTILKAKTRPGLQAIPAPSISTVARRLDHALGKYEQALKVVGPREAANQYRETSIRPRPNRSLLEVQIDDVDSGIFLIDERTGLPFGRAYVTSGIDDFDKVPMGMAVGHEYRSTETAVNCILDGLLPKDACRTEYGDLANKWIGYGHPAIHLMDNPQYNHSKRLEELQFQIQSTMAWAKPRTPTEKTSIEHFNDILKKRHFSKLPGWSDGNVKHDSVKRGMASAIMTAAQFKGLLVQWVVGEYLNAPGTDGLTPKQRREKSLNGHAPTLRWTYEQLRLFRMVHVQTKFRESGGFELLKIRFKSDSLAQIRRQVGNERAIDIYVDPNDLTNIIVEHPFTKVMIKVPCAEHPDYIAGLSMRQQRQILKQARTMKMTNPSIAECVKARNEIATTTDRMRNNHRLRQRQKAVNNAISAVDVSLANSAIENTPSGSSHQMDILMTDLEYQMTCIDEVEISDCEWSNDVH